MIFHTSNKLEYFTFKSLDVLGVKHAIFSRKGGMSQVPYDSLNLGGTVGDNPDHVLANHHLLFQTLDRKFTSRFDVWQVHGNKVLTANAPRPEGMDHPTADGMLTNASEVTLLMRFADCVPILLFDPVKNVVGLVHAGWQGTFKRIASAAIVKAQEVYGCKPQDFVAGIGPSICPECYQVGKDVYDQFNNEFGEVNRKFFKEKPDGWHLDLWKANELILQQAGVRQIEQSMICTAHNTSYWYSHRSEKGLTGRFGVVIWIG